MAKSSRKKREAHGRTKSPKSAEQSVPPASVGELQVHQSHRRAPASDEEIIRRLNELLQAERAGVEALALLRQADASALSAPELERFAQDEASACAGLYQAILRYGGQPSDRIGDFARKVASQQTEGDRLSLLARGTAWVAKRLDVLLSMPVDPDTRSFLTKMREEHLENVDACNRRAEEIEAPPGAPYRSLSFARLREAHDRLYYGAWRGPAPTSRDIERASLQLGRYLDMLGEEVQRAPSIDARKYLARARAAYAKAGLASSEDRLRHLDNALAYAHNALNALLHQYRVPAHEPQAFESFYDVSGVPFQELM